MAGVKRLEDLIAWQRGLQLCKAVYLFSKSFPPDERFGLMSQIRRAAVSVPANIAEGFGRESTDDLLRFLRISRGSLFELKTHALLAVELEYVPSASVPTDLLEETDRVLQALIRSLERPSPR